MTTPPGTLPGTLGSERGRWDALARDPYYAVINHDDFRRDAADAQAQARFEASGERDVATTIDEIRRVIAPDFAPAHVIDFGCGVGRLTIPLARLARHVTGVDISQVMLDEARRYCDARGVDNVSLVTSERYFAQPEAMEPRPDFVHSYIVFQHIPTRAGHWLATSLVRRLRPGGVGALHFTYARRASLIRRVVHRLRRRIPGVNRVANLVQGRPLGEPLIPMNRYDLGALLTMLGDLGCLHVHARLTDHGGHLGAMLLFRKDSASR